MEYATNASLVMGDTEDSLCLRKYGLVTDVVVACIAIVSSVVYLGISIAVYYSNAHMIKFRLRGNTLSTTLAGIVWIFGSIYSNGHFHIPINNRYFSCGFVLVVIPFLFGEALWFMCTVARFCSFLVHYPQRNVRVWKLMAVNLVLMLAMVSVAAVSLIPEFSHYVVCASDEDTDPYGVCQMSPLVKSMLGTVMMLQACLLLYVVYLSRNISEFLTSSQSMINAIAISMCFFVCSFVMTALGENTQLIGRSFITSSVAFSVGLVLWAQNGRVLLFGLPGGGYESVLFEKTLFSDIDRAQGSSSDGDNENDVARYKYTITWEQNVYEISFCTIMRNSYTREIFLNYLSQKGEYGTEVANFIDMVLTIPFTRVNQIADHTKFIWSRFVEPQEQRLSGEGSQASAPKEGTGASASQTRITCAVISFPNKRNDSSTRTVRDIVVEQASVVAGAVAALRQARKGWDVVPNDEDEEGGSTSSGRKQRETVYTMSQDDRPALGVDACTDPGDVPILRNGTDAWERVKTMVRSSDRYDRYSLRPIVAYVLDMLDLVYFRNFCESEFCSSRLRHHEQSLLNMLAVEASDTEASRGYRTVNL